MLNRYQLVVFDWEGTIAESSFGYVVIALHHAVARLHLSDFDVSKARQWVSSGLISLVRALYPSIALYQQEELCREVQRTLLDVSATVHLVPGVKALIEWLYARDVPMAIATNKTAQGLARVLHQSGLDDYIRFTRSATDAPAKPCPQMLEEIITNFDLSAQNTVMIGDSIADMEMAAAIGVEGVGMDFFHSEEQALRLAGARHVFHDYQQLFQHIKDN